MAKYVLKKLAKISIAKKTIGAFYINGKDHYATLIDICCSILIFIGLSFVFKNIYSGLGLIDFVKISMVSDLKTFFGKNSTYPMKFFSNENFTRIYETPWYSGELLIKNDLWPIGSFPLHLISLHTGCSNGTLDIKFEDMHGTKSLFEKQIDMIYRKDFEFKEKSEYLLNEVE